MPSLSLGKYRLMQQTSTSHHAFATLALDHRNNLRNALNPNAPDKVTYADMVAFKQEVIGALAPASSAVLLDPEVGAAQCMTSGALPGSVGLLVAVEATGYSGDTIARESRILPDWSIAKAKRMGASAVKLLVYYHPKTPTALAIETLITEVATECTFHELPLWIEPLSYSPDPTQRKLPPNERYEVVIETAQRLTIPGVDVLKAEFPLDIKTEPDENTWLKACEDLSNASKSPWVLLSASVDFETYMRQVTVACRAGASGVAVGRAVWQEATHFSGIERHHFLREVAYPRMEKVKALCDALARPWTDFFSAPIIEDGWYVTY